MGNSNKKAKNIKRSSKKAGAKRNTAERMGGRSEEKPLSLKNFGTGGRLFTLLAEKVEKPVSCGGEECVAIYGRLCGKLKSGDDLYLIDRETREVTQCSVISVLSREDCGYEGYGVGEAATIKGVAKNMRVSLLLKLISRDGQPCSLEDSIISTFSVACSAKPKTLREGGANFGLRDSVFLRGLLGSAEELSDDEEFFNLVLREIVDSTYLIPASIAAGEEAKAVVGEGESEADLWSRLEFPTMENPNIPDEDCMMLFTDVQAFRMAGEAGVPLPFESAMMDGFSQIAKVAAGNGDGLIINAFGPAAFALSTDLVKMLSASGMMM